MSNIEGCRAAYTEHRTKAEEQEPRRSNGASTDRASSFRTACRIELREFVSGLRNPVVYRQEEGEAPAPEAPAEVKKWQKRAAKLKFSGDGPGPDESRR